VKLLSERTIDGQVFRVDLRLRPDPASTQIAMSTAAALDYYESRGQNWERAALIRHGLVPAISPPAKDCSPRFHRSSGANIWISHRLPMSMP
jgi:glutamine synthetase adenylyltransferase